MFDTVPKSLWFVDQLWIINSAKATLNGLLSVEFNIAGDYMKDDILNVEKCVKTWMVTADMFGT